MAIGNVLLFALMITSIIMYTNQAKEDNYQSNINNIENIAAAKARLAQTYLNSSTELISEAYSYCQGKTVIEAITYLTKIVVKGSEYQLITNEKILDTYYYTGYSTRLNNENTYSNISYIVPSILSSALLKYNTEQVGLIEYTPKFTNVSDSLQNYASFCGIKLYDGENEKYYFLLHLQKGEQFLAKLEFNTQYENLATAVVDNESKYLIADSVYRSSSFGSYIYNYNNLTLDEQKTFWNKIIENDNGIVIYKDSRGLDCIYAYNKCSKNSGWYIIIGVPIKDFVNNSSIFSRSSLTLIIILIMLLLFNITILLLIVNRLRISIINEKNANMAKSNFMSRMSHEIRTPLNAIIGYNVIAQNELSNTKNKAKTKHAENKILDCLNKSDIASHHLLSVINDVLDMSTIESGKLKINNERFDFKDLISSLTTIFYSQATLKNVEFEVVVNGLTEQWFIGDELRINQILTNLLSNAIKFTPSFGSVLFTITEAVIDNKKSRFNFIVKDTGIGMNDEFINNIWTPFEQADSSISRHYGGTGLGLAITKNLVDCMDGEIVVDSKLGIGTTFTVTIDLEKAEKQNEYKQYDFHKVKALIVDDNLDACNYLSILFTNFGANVVTTSSGKEAIEVFKKRQSENNPFTICLIDNKMPEMDGLETIRQIKTNNNDNSIIIVMAYDINEIETETFGVTNFITKPLFKSTVFDLLCGIKETKVIYHELYMKKIFDKAKILLVEDNNMNMEIATTIMENIGIIVDQAWNGKEAVDKFTSSLPGEYVAILMDLHMPQMDGYTATRLIRKSSHLDANSIPIIALTADAFTDNVIEAHKAGMNDHIAKPLNVDVLLTTLKKYIVTK